MAKFGRANVEPFTPESAELRAREIGIQDLKREYQKYRKMANERLRKLTMAGYGQSEIVKSNRNLFPSLPEIGADKQMLYDAMAEVTRFLSAKTSTVGGQREREQKIAETFERHFAHEFYKYDPKILGEVMAALKSRGDDKAFYRNWKRAYRGAVARAEKLGISSERLSQEIRAGMLEIGIHGGILDARTQRSITAKWAALGR